MNYILLQVPINELLVYILGGGLVLAFIIIVALLVKRKDTDEPKAPTNPLDVQIEERKQTLPMQLQAYERLTLLMDRIEIINLVKRVGGAGFSLKQQQFQLIEHIRQEFEHNVTQQLYVSDESWYLIKTAIEGTISDINNVANSLTPDSNGQDLNRALLNFVLGKQTASPSQNAINQMRVDVGNLV